MFSYKLKIIIVELLVALLAIFYFTIKLPFSESLFLLPVIVLILYNSIYKIYISKKISKLIVDIQEKERKRIARELHDSLGQLISTSKLLLSSVVLKEDQNKKIIQCSTKVLNEAQNEMHRIIGNLLPLSIEKFGLSYSLEELAKNINLNNSVLLKFYCKITSDISDEVSLHVYRIIQEVINNSIKYSNAKNIDLEVIEKDNFLYINIADDGKGFNINEINNSKGIGWNNIYTRLSLINGKICINSQKMLGTKIIVKIRL